MEQVSVVRGVWFHSSTHRKAVAKVVLHLVVYIVFKRLYVVVGCWGPEMIRHWCAADA